MGLGIVLVFWMLASGLLASVGAAILASITFLLTLGLGDRRKRVLLFAATLPFGAVVWAGVVFVILAIVNTTTLGRDIGIGDTWYAPLPNGYTISMIDTMDQASLCPGRASVEVCPDGEDISGVTQMQVSGPYVLGKTEFGPQGQFGSFFLLDTRSKALTNVATLPDLTVAARSLGIRVNLQPVESVYAEYRFGRADGVAGIAAIMPPLSAIAFLGLWIVRLRFRRNVSVD